MGDGQAKKFAREATAGMLNAAHDEINYPMTINEVTRMVQDSIIDEDYKDAEKEFRAYNKIGEETMCP